MRSPTIMRGGRVYPANAEDIRQNEIDHERWLAEAPERALEQEIADLRRQIAAKTTRREKLEAEAARLRAEIQAGGPTTERR